MKKKVLIIHPGQYGYHTSTYFYCYYLREKYDVTYIGFNEGRPRKEVPGVHFINLNANAKSLANRISLFRSVKALIKNDNFSFILLNYFPLCSFLRLIIPFSLTVEIRSSYVFQKILLRKIYNTFMTIEIRLFKNVTTISSGIAKYLHMPQKTVIIPLGGVSQPERQTSNNSIKMLYVGTFMNRNIENTIYAFARFSETFNKKIDISYSIIGFGPEEDRLKIHHAIESTKMNNHVSFLGEIRYPELVQFLNRSNVGISYIPLTEYYDMQPPTKTFEYLLHGMIVIGTHTSEHKKVINHSNGILTGDSIDELFTGMVKLYQSLSDYSSTEIQKSSQKYTWKNIINNTFIPFMDESH